MVRILHYHGNGQTLLEFALVYERTKKFGGCGSNKSHRAQCSKRILKALTKNCGCACSSGDPRSLVTVRHYGFSGSKCGGIAAQNGNNAIRAHGALCQ